MVAQVPFQGVTLAELGAEGDSPAVTVDAQLVDEPAPPRAFVALGSHRGARLDPYVIVEVPGSGAPAPTGPDTAAEAAFAEVLEAEVDLERSRAAAAEEAAAVERTTVATRSSPSSALERAQLQARRRASLRRGARARRDRSGGTSRVAPRGRPRWRWRSARTHEVAARGRALVELSAELGRGSRSGRRRSRTAMAQVEALAQRTERANERAWPRVEPQLSLLADGRCRGGPVASRRRSGIAPWRRCAPSKAEVARRDRMVRELVGDRRDGATAPGTANGASELVAADNARLRERLDAMARDLARRQARRGRPRRGRSRSSRASRPRRPRRARRGTTRGASWPRGRHLPAALDEIDALRKALVQEHELRLRAEAALTSPPSTGLPAPSQS